LKNRRTSLRLSSSQKAREIENLKTLLMSRSGSKVKEMKEITKRTTILKRKPMMERDAAYFGR